MPLKLTIFRKGLILISVPLLFQLAFIWLVADMQETNADAQEAENHSKNVLRQTQVVLRSLLDAETGIRGYALTEDAAYAEPYERANVELADALGELQRLVSDNADQKAKGRVIAAKAAQLMDLYADEDRLLRERKRDVVVGKVGTGTGKRQMDEIRGEIATFLQEEERLDGERDAYLMKSKQRLNWLLVAGSAAALLITGLLAFAFYRGVGSRLVALTENSHRLAQGKMLTPALGGSDEVAQLDLAFHEMAGALSAAGRRERAYAESLETRVAERTAELGENNRQLSQKNEENEMFVYSVSHDLRSPLVNLQGFGEELRMACDDLRGLLMAGEVPAGVRDRGLAVLDKDMAESVRFILNGVLRLSNIIDALLRLSRAGRVEYQWQDVDVGTAVARIIESMKGTAERCGATVKVNGLLPAWGDPTALDQVFANLIANALNYLDPERPGVIEVGDGSAREGTPDGYRTYYVKDNGLGIPEAHQQKVFQIFQRAHQEVANGEGIGLAIVRRVVERHRGKVWVESRPGAGSSFFMTLPTAPANVSLK